MTTVRGITTIRSGAARLAMVAGARVLRPLPVEPRRIQQSHHASTA